MRHLESHKPVLLKRPKKMHQVVQHFNLNRMTAQVVQPRTGRIEQSFRATSYVSNFLKKFRSPMKAAYTPALTLAGTENYERRFCKIFDTKQSTSLDQQGILVGTSATAPDVANYDLNARYTIPDITYSGMTDTGYTPTEGNMYFDLIRTVTAEADAQVIREIGLASYTGSAAASLIAHDLLVTPVTLNTGEARIFRYRLHFDGLSEPMSQHLYASFAHQGGLSKAKDWTGVLRRVGDRDEDNYLDIEAAIDEIDRGHRLSANTDAIAWDAYTIGGTLYPITEFQHAAQVIGAITVDSVTDTAYFDVTRDFVNISGVNKTVAKAGLYFYGDATNYLYTWLLCGALLPTPITVLAGEGIRITYRFSIAT